MSNKKQNVWMVRAGRGSYLIDEFINEGVVAVGWNDIGQLNEKISQEDLKNKFRKVYPDSSPGNVNQSVGQIWRLFNDFKPGDKVVTYDSSLRVYHLGEIESNYQFLDKLEYKHCRGVKWEKNTVDRDLLTTPTKNTLGSILTIFELSPEIWNELKSASKNKKEKIETESEKKEYLDAIDQYKEDIISRSKEFIKDIISNLSWEDTETFVAGLLSSMGYKTRLTSRGSDLGSDIIASPDELGIEEPIVKVEVKKRTENKISAPEIRNFIGGLRGHHKGIYFTTSGFTKEARYEAERANYAISLVDSDWMVELLINNYETLAPEIKALVPLRKIYWPV